MPAARTHSVALAGVDGHRVEIDAGIENGPPGLLPTGLPDTAAREAGDRVKAAVISSGQQWPQRRVTVTLSPAGLHKPGNGFDPGCAVTWPVIRLTRRRSRRQAPIQPGCRGPVPVARCWTWRTCWASRMRGG